jgi:hypothetical protein
MCLGVCKVDVLTWFDVLAKGWQKAHARQKNVLTTTTRKENDAWWSGGICTQGNCGMEVGGHGCRNRSAVNHIA